MKEKDAAGAADYVTAGEAMKRLAVQRQTLYAYVSRGLIRSLQQPGRRDRLYARDDIERMRARSQARTGDGVVGASAMQYGEPIVPTSVTEITADGPRYRGHLAIELAAQHMTFEAVAELLWTGHLYDAEFRWDAAPLPAAVQVKVEAVAASATQETFLEVMALVVLQLGTARGGIEERLRKGEGLNASRQAIQTIVGCLGGLSRRRRYLPVDSEHGVAWSALLALGGKTSVDNCQAMNAMLVLLADHELAPGTFAARVAASSGATLHSCLASALCTHSGVRVGRIYDTVERFLGERGTRELLKQVQDDRRLGRSVPGFMHPRYPKGDPRAQCLLELARQRRTVQAPLATLFGLLDGADRSLALQPSAELLVVTLCREMGLAPGSGAAIFALARSVGWVAHVMEQRLSSVLLRPRAKFVMT